MFRHAYFHGFASSPGSRKGAALAAAFDRRGTPLLCPDLNVPSFALMTISRMLAAADALDAAGTGRWRIVGSSLGSYVAALWAGLHPDRVDRLVLLCPAFDMERRWPARLGEAAMERWRTTGWLPFPDHTGTPTPVHLELFTDLGRHEPVAGVACPTLIIHGTRDDLVPIDGSRRYAAAHPNVRLIEVDDDHLLTASTGRIVSETLAFFAL